jgi:RNA polymerase sigma-70 factor (ECF subfamily)
MKPEPSKRAWHGPAAPTEGGAAAAVLARPLLARDGRGYVRAMELEADRASAAIEGVVARFRALVRSVGARRGLADADLDEVLQDVRIRLWQAGKAGKALDELGSSYLYKVATTAALDLLRGRRSRGGDRTDDIEAVAQLPAPGSSPAADAEARELGEQIEAALEALSIDRRVAVRFYLSGYDHRDIARACAWSEARARNLLYRGLEDLRRRLASAGVATRTP